MPRTGLYGMRQGAAGGCGGIERYEARDVLASREVCLFFLRHLFRPVKKRVSFHKEKALSANFAC